MYGVNEKHQIKGLKVTCPHNLPKYTIIYCLNMWIIAIALGLWLEVCIDEWCLQVQRKWKVHAVVALNKICQKVIS